MATGLPEHLCIPGPPHLGALNPLFSVPLLGDRESTAMAPPCGDAAAAPELTSLRISEGAGLPPLPGRYRPFCRSLSDSLTDALRQPSTEGFGVLFAQAKRRRQCG